MGRPKPAIGWEDSSRRQLHELKHGEPEGLLENLRGLCRELGDSGEGDGGALKIVQTSLGYLEKRRDQIRYVEFQAEGYPIGSGAVESANKLVVEARLKGSGMHWARAHVDPMLALRTVVSAVTGGKRSGLKSANGYGKRPGSAGWDDGSGQEGQRVWKQRRIPGHRLGRDHQAPSSVPGNVPGQSTARPLTLAQALIGYPQQTTLGAAWSAGENASLHTFPNHPTRKPDAHPVAERKLRNSLVAEETEV